ncbi:MAG: DUF3048 C-terminal domain-containing protein [Clostridia bacterium]|nr:DUF3048 C-terminal domain-containing protein [Clostridia bacterium]
MKKLLVLVLIAMLAAGFAGCKEGEVSGNTPGPSETASATASPVESGTQDPTASPETSAEPSEEPGEDPTQSPEPSEEPVEGGFKVPVKGTRPWAVSIDNQGEIPFPQGGLEDAQIVYELPVEGGVTRYLALFWDADVDLIGPVRSARDYMLDCFAPYDALFMHVGGSPQALADLRDNKQLVSLNAMINAWPIYRDLTSDPKNWQDTFATGERINEYLSDYAITTITTKGIVPKYHDEMTEAAAGLSATTINISYSKNGSRCAYIYDSSLMLYFRNRDGKSHIDKNTGKPIGVANIIIQKVDSRIIAGDTEGRLEVDMVGTGTGYFISGGKSVDITWEKTERFGPTVYYGPDGKEIVLNPGNTWIQVTTPTTSIMIL